MFYQKLHVDMVGALALKQLGLRDAAAVLYQPTNQPGPGHTLVW